MRVGQSYSAAAVVENCVPQGSVLSVTLFGIMVNRSVKHLLMGLSFHASLYVDLQIAYQHIFKSNSTKVTKMGHREWFQIFCCEN